MSLKKINTVLAAAFILFILWFGTDFTPPGAGLGAAGGGPRRVRRHPQGRGRSGDARPAARLTRAGLPHLLRRLTTITTKTNVAMSRIAANAMMTSITPMPNMALQA
jgi:hypothetical protein